MNKEGDTVDKEGKAVKVQGKGRHAPCVGIRATPSAEAMVALTLIDHYLRNRAQNSGITSTTPVVPSEI